MGCVSPAAREYSAEPGRRRFSSTKFWKPPEVVSVIAGSRAARALSTLAWAEASVASACQTSGRRTMISAGRPGATTGSRSAARDMVGRGTVCGTWPVNVPSE